VNISLETGRLDPALPFIKKAGVEALVAPYRTEEEAREKIAAFIRDFYARRYPEVATTRKESIDRAIDELRAIYGRSIFPLMRADWRVHPDNIGHMMFDGCFRCHDNKHAGAAGALPKGCDVCHDFGLQLAGPDTGMALLKVRPEHPVKLEGAHAELSCARCHTGGPAPDASCAGCHETQRLFRQGKSPSLDGLNEVLPAVMADLDCESCHDLSKPQQSADLAKQCESCHDKGYGDMVQTWKDDAAASRAKAVAAIEELKKSISTPRDPAAQLAARLEAAVSGVDRAGAHHNTDFAEAVYQQVVKLASK
jgi:hypothetical protein